MSYDYIIIGPNKKVFLPNTKHSFKKSFKKSFKLIQICLEEIL